MLNTPIRNLHNITTHQTNALKELNISTLKDLIHYYPIKYLDKTKFYTIHELNNSAFISKYVQIKGTIKSKNIITKNNKQRLSVSLQDQTGSIELIWFHYIKERDKSLLVNNEYKVFGQINNFNQHLSIVHPEIELYSATTNNQNRYLQSVYRISDGLKRYKLNSKTISQLINQTLIYLKDDISEYIPTYITEKHKLLSLKEALFNIHFPKNTFLLNEAIKRLKFEELFLLQVKMLQTKQIIKTQNLNNFIFSKVGNNFYTLYNNLPFKLTAGQRKVIKEIRNDLLKPTQMNRLLQGDVGSGKTIVALFSSMLALDNGYQACIMAPTEILAQQHYSSSKKLLTNSGINIALITGSTSKKERNEILQQLQENKIHILIGTHTIIQPNVKFHNLGLAIIDEQHKFGVKQRSELWTKNTYPPHLLLMTATPIPRTLSMTAYGNLDMSIIDTLPTGRKPIITVHKYETYRSKTYDFIKSQLNEGRQAYIVYPIIEESASLDYLNLMEGYKHISKAFNSEKYKIGLVHGKMSIEDKEVEMQKFKDGITNILVATPVIEVGIDVPNATIILIESCNRFGLSQLHQLRGRIGRSDKQSYCILMTPYNISQEVKHKINTMVSTNDGFLIADADLKLRGPGDIEGIRQSGVMELKIANLITDIELIGIIQTYVQNIFKKDPYLTDLEHSSVNKYLSDLKYNTMARIS